MIASPVVPSRMMVPGTAPSMSGRQMNEASPGDWLTQADPVQVRTSPETGDGAVTSLSASSAPVTAWPWSLRAATAAAPTAPDPPNVSAAGVVASKATIVASVLMAVDAAPAAAAVPRTIAGVPKLVVAPTPWPCVPVSVTMAVLPVVADPWNTPKAPAAMVADEDAAPLVVDGKANWPLVALPVTRTRVVPCVSTA